MRRILSMGSIDDHNHSNLPTKRGSVFNLTQRNCLPKSQYEDRRSFKYSYCSPKVELARLPIKNVTSMKSKTSR